MKLFKFFKKKPEQKSEVIVNNILSIINDLQQSVSLVDVNSITFNHTINFYKSVAPLAKAINIIAKAFAQIEILIEDIETGEFENEHEILTLLKSPNADITGTEFQRQIATFYLLLGNTMIEANGGVNKPPLELWNKAPQFFSIESDSDDGYAALYRFTSNAKEETWFRNDVEGRFRFYSQTDLNELWHIRNFNPNFSAGQLFGMQPILPIAIEIEQYARSSNHNLSLLMNGARLSGLLLKEGVLNDKQYQRLKQQLDEQYTGDRKAGKLMLAESGDGKMDFKELGQTNKDMDFKENKTDVRYGIYNQYGIPLPLVSPTHMTMSNYTEARLALYDDTVLPLADLLLEELTNFLFHRYPDLEGKKLSYNPQSITALLERSNKDIKAKVDSKVLKPDEIRALYEHEPLEGDVGNVVYQPSNLVPMGTEVIEDDSQPDVTQDAFAKILRKSGFNENQIKAAIKRHYKEN